MEELTAEQLDRLIRSNRRLKISAAVAVGAIIVVVAILIANDLDFAIRGGAGLGVLIGLLLLIPHRRVLRELDLTNSEANVILGIERDRRTGVAALPMLERARRESTKAKICLAIGLVLLVVAVVELPYFFSAMGEVQEEGTPLDPAFVASIFLGWGGLVIGLIILMVASGFRSIAADMRMKAVESGEVADSS